MPLYHVSERALEPGTVLEGKFGLEEHAKRIYPLVFSALHGGESTVETLLLGEDPVAGYDRREIDLPVYLKEAVFEEVRASEFPRCPKRLGSCFAFASLSDAMEWRRTGEKPSYLYLCQATGGRQGRFEMTLVGRANQSESVTNQVAELMERARKYWGGEENERPVWEIVTEGEVKILAPVIG